MAECDSCCGTSSHGGSFPVVGDPDLNNQILNAVAVFGGIRLFWDYPAVLPEAVSYTRIYRSANPDPATAVDLVKVSADFYLDPVDSLDATTYYYWIRRYSVHGTEGELIGPASATARPTTEQMLEKLSDAISSTVLAQELRTEIARIGDISFSLDDEIVNRSNALTTMATSLDNLQQGVTASVAYVNSEVFHDRTGNSALAGRLDTLLVGTDEGASLAQIVSQEVAEVGDGISSTEVVAIAQSEITDAFGESSLAAIQNKWGTFVTGDEAYAYSMTQTDVNGLLGGYGIYNDGENVTTLFDVDRFAVGRREGTDVVDHKFTMYEMLKHTAAVDTGTKVFLDNYAPISICSPSNGKVSVRMPNYYLPQGKRWRAIVANTSFTGGGDRYFDYRNIYNASDHTEVLFTPTSDGKWLEAEITSAYLTSDFSTCYVAIGVGGLSATQDIDSSVSMWETVSAHITSANGTSAHSTHIAKPQILTANVDGVITFAPGTSVSAEAMFLENKFTFSDVSPATPFGFIVDEEGVFIDFASVKNLDVGELLSANTITASVRMESLEFVGGSLDINGLFTVSNTGEVDIRSSTSGERMEIKNDSIKIFSSTSSTAPLVVLGKLS